MISVLVRSDGRRADFGYTVEIVESYTMSISCLVILL
jgi:hypothetical protein